MGGSVRECICQKDGGMVGPYPKANGGISHLVELAVGNEEVICSCVYFMRGGVECVIPFSRVLKAPHVD